MSISIFSCALSRTLRRNPISHELTACLNCALFSSSSTPLRSRSAQYPRRRRSSLSSTTKNVRAYSSELPLNVPVVALPEGTPGGSDGYSILEGRTDGPQDPALTPPPEWSQVHFLTPAPDLLKTLHTIGCCKDINANVQGKFDLSWASPLHNPLKRSEIIPDGFRRIRWNAREVTNLYIYYLEPLLSLKAASSIFKISRSPELTHVLSKVFTPESKRYLEDKNCSEEDVNLWAWILMAEDARTAMRRLEEAQDMKPERNFPLFLVSFILRRKPSRSTLETMIPVVESLFSPTNPFQVKGAWEAVTILVRLLRCVREVWPAALPWVVELFTAHVNAPEVAEGENLPAWVTHVYNRFISLLSIPTHDAPFRFIPIVQKCQFALVEKLAAMEGRITREGYRGLVNVQLAHEKTPREKERARNMQTNWPPWPVDKDGWVAARRNPGENFDSRAGTVLNQMTEAGYTATPWENSARILAGKDLDDSPTIQTRTINDKRSNIWAARIIATRTIEEAWSNFVECLKDVQPRKPSKSVYHAMCGKIIAASKLNDHLRKEERAKWVTTRDTQNTTRAQIWRERQHEAWIRNVPGDYTEVISPPRNPKYGIYNDVPPPTLTEFFAIMQQDGIAIYPQKRLAVTLIKEAPSTQFASAVLMQWNSEHYAEILTADSLSEVLTRTSSKGEKLDWAMLTAFLIFLCKKELIERALQLLLYYKPPYNPAWTAVALELAWAPTLKTYSAQDRAWRLKTALSLYEQRSGLMDFDHESLRVLASIVEKWCTEGKKNGILDPKAPIAFLVRTVWENWGIETVKSCTPPPMWPRVPILHSVIRALGTAGEWSELEQLIKFLDEINFDLNSKHLGRLSLVAARVFLVGAARTGVRSEDLERSKTLERLDPIVNARWGGWGSADPNVVEREMRDYMIMGGLSIGTVEL